MIGGGSAFRPDAGEEAASRLREANGGLTGFRFIPWSMVGVVQLSSRRLAYDVSDDRTDGYGIGISRLARAAETVQALSDAAGAMLMANLAKGLANEDGNPLENEA